jgi:hypothetical protein
MSNRCFYTLPSSCAIQTENMVYRPSLSVIYTRLVLLPLVRSMRTNELARHKDRPSIPDTAGQWSHWTAAEAGYASRWVTSPYRSQPSGCTSRGALIMWELKEEKRQHEFPTYLLFQQRTCHATDCMLSSGIHVYTV